MPRALDQAKALNEDLDRMRRGSSVISFELKKIARALLAAEVPDVEPHWLDAMAREISLGSGPFIPVPVSGPGCHRG